MLEAELANVRGAKLESDAARRQLSVQLKSELAAVRVFCRVRPMLDARVDGTYRLAAEARRLTVEQLQQSNTGGAAVPRRWPFELDGVFDADATQADVYKHVAPLGEMIYFHRLCIDLYGCSASCIGR